MAKLILRGGDPSFFIERIYSTNIFDIAPSALRQGVGARLAEVSRLLYNTPLRSGSRSLLGDAH